MKIHKNFVNLKDKFNYINSNKKNKFSKQNNTPFKEISNSKNFNSPSSNFSDFSLNKNKQLKKFKINEEDNTLKNIHKILSGKHIVKNSNNIQIDKINSNSKNKNNNNCKSNKNVKLQLNQKNDSIKSFSINIDNLKEFLNIKNYKGKLLKLLDDNKITEKCISNDNKKSKFFITNDESFQNIVPNFKNILRGLCSKCAVKVANIGIKCEEILNDIVDLRRKKWENFNSNYNNLKIIINNTYFNLKNFKNNLKDTRKEQKSSLITKIDKIFKFINLKKEKIIKLIDLKYKEEITNIKIILNKLDNFNNKIDKFYFDIEKNYQYIINKEFNQKKFNLILKNYEIKINDIYKHNEKINSYKSNLPILQFDKEIFNEEDNITNINLFKWIKKEFRFDNNFSQINDSNFKNLDLLNKNNLQIDEFLIRSNFKELLKSKDKYWFS